MPPFTGSRDRVAPGSVDPEDLDFDFDQAVHGAVDGTYAQLGNLSVNVMDYGAVGDGVADDAAAIQAAIDAVEAAGGGTVYLPTGVYKCNSTLVVDGAATSALFTWAIGGVEIVGDGIRGTILVGASGDTLMQWGSGASKQNLTLKNLALIGPGKTDSGSIGLDSRTTGGGYVFDNVLVERFQIGIRLYDNTLVDGRHLNVRQCTTGMALGFYSDAQHYEACRFDQCTTAVHIGYVDPVRDATLVPTESHALNFVGCIANGNGVSWYIQGAATECVNILGCYSESYTDVCVRVADSAFARTVSAIVNIDNCYMNGSDGVDHAIEVNRALVGVNVRGGGYRNHRVSPVNVRRNDAKVLVDIGHYDTSSGEDGDVQLPDGTWVNVRNGRGVRVGQMADPVSIANSLPTATVDWLGAHLVVAGVSYRCMTVGSGYAWVEIDSFVPSSERIWAAPTGAKAQTFDRSGASAANQAFLASARLGMVGIYLRAGTVVTSITFVSATTALSAGTNQWFALYSSARAKLAVTSDDTSTAWAANTAKTLNLTTPYTVPTSGFYYVGICVVATTVPTLTGIGTLTSISGLAPIITGDSTTGLTDPASAPATAAALTARGIMPYAYVS